MIAHQKGQEEDEDQDAHFVSKTGLGAYVVCDGHGRRGGDIAKSVASAVSTRILANLIERKALGHREFGEVVVKDAIVSLGDMGDGDSGTTVAGVFYDPRSRIAYAYTVGDSLCIVSAPDGEWSIGMPLQNATNIVASIRDDDLVGRIGSGRSYYMLSPSSGIGVQPYSVIGDEDVKKDNPFVGVHPVVRAIGPLPVGTAFFIATDGYIENFVDVLDRAALEKIVGECVALRWNASALLEAALKRGSRDDITVITSHSWA